MNSSEIAIHIENLSKQYRLGTIGTGTISHDLNRWWAQIRGKENPYLKIGETNDRAQTGDSQYVWSLKDINFEVKKGEVLGIIGKNGAGKSTLLKILSKVTGPTTGRILAKGRIGALLEVGTGFHPELTGRENIFLNGAILGMTKAEIRLKLDEIIDFSGCARYIDTPVKRYSSGMKVRLAFAVAAFLEPEILIVDEVLAVGDAEFQKKAIGKMQDVSRGEGRTVLFVSHNMGAISELCTRAILLNNGLIHAEGETEDIIHQYVNSSSNGEIRQYSGIVNNTVFRRLSFSKTDEILSSIFDIAQSFSIFFTYELLNDFDKIDLAVLIHSKGGLIVFTLDSDDYPVLKSKGRKKGIYEGELVLNGGVFPPGFYEVSIYLRNPTDGSHFNALKEVMNFQVENMNENTSDKGYSFKRSPAVILQGKWQYESL